MLTQYKNWSAFNFNKFYAAAAIRAMLHPFPDIITPPIIIITAAATNTLKAVLPAIDFKVSSTLSIIEFLR